METIREGNIYSYCINQAKDIDVRDLFESALPELRRYHFFRHSSTSSYPGFENEILITHIESKYLQDLITIRIDFVEGSKRELMNFSVDFNNNQLTDNQKENIFNLFGRNLLLTCSHHFFLTGSYYLSMNSFYKHMLRNTLI